MNESDLTVTRGEACFEMLYSLEFSISTVAQRRSQCILFVIWFQFLPSILNNLTQITFSAFLEREFPFPLNETHHAFNSSPFNSTAFNSDNNSRER